MYKKAFNSPKMSLSRVFCDPSFKIPGAHKIRGFVPLALREDFFNVCVLSFCYENVCLLNVTFVMAFYNGYLKTVC